MDLDTHAALLGDTLDGFEDSMPSGATRIIVSSSIPDATVFVSGHHLTQYNYADAHAIYTKTLPKACPNFPVDIAECIFRLASVTRPDVDEYVYLPFTSKTVTCQCESKSESLVRDCSVCLLVKLLREKEMFVRGLAYCIAPEESQSRPPPCALQSPLPDESKGPWKMWVKKLHATTLRNERGHSRSSGGVVDKGGGEKQHESNKENQPPDLFRVFGFRKIISHCQRLLTDSLSFIVGPPPASVPELVPLFLADADDVKKGNVMHSYLYSNFKTYQGARKPSKLNFREFNTRFEDTDWVHTVAVTLPTEIPWPEQRGRRKKQWDSSYATPEHHRRATLKAYETCLRNAVIALWHAVCRLRNDEKCITGFVLTGVSKHTGGHLVKKIVSTRHAHVWGWFHGTYPFENPQQFKEGREAFLFANSVIKESEDENNVRAQNEEEVMETTGTVTREEALEHIDPLVGFAHAVAQSFSRRCTDINTSVQSYVSCQCTPMTPETYHMCRGQIDCYTKRGVSVTIPYRDGEKQLQPIVTEFVSRGLSKLDMAMVARKST